MKQIKAWAIMETPKRLMKSISEFEQFEIYQTLPAARTQIRHTNLKIEIQPVIISFARTNFSKKKK